MSFRAGVTASLLSAMLLLLFACKTQNTYPNLIIILVDTLRVDHLQFFGYSRQTSPKISEFAAHSISFMKHYSTSSRTEPAVASIFTGSFPPSHGVMNPLTYFDAKPILREENVTLAEILSQAGYQCYGLVANVNVAGRFGFDQGFRKYEFIPSMAAPDLSKRMTALLKSRRKRKPFFLYLHYMEPHSPYSAPQTYKKMFVDPSYQGPITGGHGQLDSIVAGEMAVSPEDISHLKGLYNQEIRYFDDEFGKIVDFLKSQKVFDNSVILFVSDHGEEFFDHGSVLHGYTLYDEQLHVPCVIHYPGCLQGAKITQNTRHVDLLPTLIELLGIPERFKGQGRSLTGLMKLRPDKDLSLPVYSHVSLRAVKTVRMQSLMTHEWKLIETLFPSKGRELFRILEDPGEKTNLINEFPDIAESLSVRMKSFIESLPAIKTKTRKMTPDEKEKLRALGYIK